MARHGELSERGAWESVLGFLDQIEAARSAGQRGLEIDRARALAVQMLAQVNAGVHANPSGRFRANPGLLVWPNPPRLDALGKKFSDRVYDIRYKHVDDRQDYEHPFTSAVQLWKVAVGDSDGVLIVGARGQQITKEF